MKKNVFCSLLSVVLMLVYTIMPTSQVCAQVIVQNPEYQEIMQDQQTTNATKYLEGEMNAIREVISSCEKEFGIGAETVALLKLGKPFVIYDADKDVQEDCYYYPLVNSVNHKIMAVVSLANTTEGWTYTINKEWIDKLTECRYLEQTYLFYRSGKTLVAESENQKVVLQGKEEKDGFVSKGYTSKKTIIAKKMNKRKKVKVNYSKKQTSSVLYGYSPTTSTSSGGYYYCNLHKPQGQGTKSICWAAAAATTINYCKGTSYTAMNVVNKLNVDDTRQDGGTIQRALTTYGLDYLFNSSKVPTWKLIKNSIKKKKPVILCGKGYFGGHAVTVVGYRTAGAKSYVMLWDSALSKNGTQGAGNTSIAAYKNGNIVFESLGYTYATFGSCHGRSISYK